MKTQFRISSLILIALALCACKVHRAAESGNVPRITPPASSVAGSTPPVRDGGVNGGGGGTLPASTVHLHQVQTIISEGRSDLMLMVKRDLIHYAFQDSPNTRDKKLFGGPKTIFDVLIETDIDILMDRPCLDRSGVEVDGSVVGKTENSICISAYRIAPKLVQENARGEILGLVMHELSHKLGTTEEEAEELQSWYVSRINGRFEAAPLDAKGYLKRIDDLLGRLITDLKILDEEFEKLSLADLSRMVDDLSSALSNVYPEFSEFSLMDAQELEWFDVRRIKLIFSNYYLLGQGGKSYYVEKLNHISNGRREITYSELAKSGEFASLSGKHYGSEAIVIPNNMDDVRLVIKQILTMATDLRNIAAAIRDGHRPYYRLDSKVSTLPSPFEKFVGEYTIARSTCERGWLSGGATSVSVTRASTGEIYLRIAGSYFSSSNSLAEGQYFYTGPSRISGDAHSATLMSETGNRWRLGGHLEDSNNLNVSTLRMEMKDREVILSQSWLQRTYNSDKQERVDQVSGCEVRLNRI